MDPTVDQLRRQLVEAHDEIARLRGLLRRALKEAPNGLHVEASNELVEQMEATRIRAQESAIAELWLLAQTYIDESAPPSRSSRGPSTKADAKPSVVTVGGRRTPRPSTAAADATSTPPGGVTRRPPRRPSTRSRKPTDGRSSS